jgi:excisionase family DNA binding protein
VTLKRERAGSSPRAELTLHEPLLNAAAAGVILGGVPPKTVLQLAREGRLPCLRIGRHVRFDRAELATWLSQRRTL